MFFNALSEIDIPRNVGYFRLMTRQVADDIVRLPQQPYFLRGVGAWVGYRQAPLPYVRDPRTAGISGWPMKRMLQLATQGIVSFSTVPLRLPLYLAGGCAIGLLLVAESSRIRTGFAGKFDGMVFGNGLICAGRGPVFSTRISNVRDGLSNTFAIGETSAS